MRDVVLMAVHEFEKGLRVREFLDLDFIRALTKFSPHGVQHQFGQCPLSVILGYVVTVQRNPLSNLVGGDMGGALVFCGTVGGPSTGFLFQFEPRVYVLGEEPGL